MTVSYSETAAFGTPATLTGLVATPNSDSICLDLTWTASGDTFHYEYLIEGQSGDGAWTEIGRSATNAFSWYLVPLNTPVRVRVSDSNGAIYSATTEVASFLTYLRWALTNPTGDAAYLTELRYVQPQEATDIPLDQTVIQPLSGPTGDTQLPIVITGQWQGERIAFSLLIKPSDRYLITMLRNAARVAIGGIYLKDPKGSVYAVQLGSFRLTDLGAGNQQVEFTAIRIA
jgi:hypothetical protein